MPAPQMVVHWGHLLGDKMQCHMWRQVQHACLAPPVCGMPFTRIPSGMCADGNAALTQCAGCKCPSDALQPMHLMAP